MHVSVTLGLYTCADSVFGQYVVGEGCSAGVCFDGIGSGVVGFVVLG